jgi:hypothetical protein
MANAYGGLYVTAGATAQALSTTAAKMTGFAAAYTGASSDGDQSVVPVLASDHVTLKPGRYLVNFNCSANVATINIEVTYDLRAGATAVSTVPKAKVEASDAAAVTCASFSGVFTVATEANYSVYVASESSTPNLTPVEANLSFVRLDG